MAIPGSVAWGYGVAAVLFAIGLGTIFRSGDWGKARGAEKIVLLGPLLYAAPLAAFGTEHFTRTADIASIVPPFVPWHTFWAYFVGACFLAAPLSIATRVQTRLAASLLALTFFLFVMMMDVPALIQDAGNRITWVLSLRELTFSSGALALAASLPAASRASASRIQIEIARYITAVAVLFYSFEQFRHADHVPAVPLERLTSAYIPGHSFWTYATASVYALGGTLLLIGKKSRAAATAIGLSILVAELAVYLPIGIVDRGSLDNGLNYVFDTLMFCGAILLVAGAMPREDEA